MPLPSAEPVQARALIAGAVVLVGLPACRHVGLLAWPVAVEVRQASGLGGSVMVSAPRGGLPEPDRSAPIVAYC